MAEEIPPNNAPDNANNEGAGNQNGGNGNQRRGNPRNNRERGVRGPSSALSSFLREKGITVPTNPYTRIQQQENPAQNGENSTTQMENVETTCEQVPESTSRNEATEMVPEFPAKKEEPIPIAKRKRRIPDDENYLKLIKLCETCKRRFISHSEQSNCHACLSVGAKASKAVKKQRKKQ